MTITLCCLCAVSSIAGTGPGSAARIDSMMSLLASRHQFNGSVLVAVHNAVLYRNGFGFADVAHHLRFTTGTPSYLASVSKQFTAMAVMILAERGLLGYADSITHYIPQLSPVANGITIEQLLHHTSGLPDYYALGLDHPGVTNDEILDSLYHLNALRFRPGDTWEYSNSGYVVLSLLVERVSGLPFARFMKDNIFEPLGMSDTFVYDGSQSLMPERARGYTRFGSDNDYNFLTTGAGGIFSTADDLFRWNQALYGDALVSRETLHRAFAPARLNADSTVAYGFGWVIGAHNGGMVVHHSGGLAGFRTFLTRYLADSSAIILLTNMASNDLGFISVAIRAALDGVPCALPKPGIADTMSAILRNSDVASAIRFYRTERASHDTTFNYNEPELHDLGLYLLHESAAQAVAILTLNTEQYPSSAGAFTTLATALQKSGQHDEALISCTKALSLNPTYLPARALMRALQKP